MVSIRPGWPLTIFVAIFFPVFVGLGIWQLNRANEKAQLEAQIQAGREVRLLAPAETPVLYQHYQVSGRLDNRHLWLLDNRTHQGRAGYEVWLPLVTDSGWYLVSAGWVAGSSDRHQLPDVVLPNDYRPWLAQTRPLSRTITLDQAEQNSHWPQRIQTLDPDLMAAQLDRSKPLGLLQLTEGQPGVGPIIWTPTVMTAQRHRGYAVQWFGMAVALVLMYVYAGYRFAQPTQTNSHKEDSE
ncbi:SURF1 family protein [Saccharospirillum mangrovi]|uniref:SURF1 family protein n=1 Tax=Saccharospirillum mangrovi TaxID=2161747 RepID=UPI000D33AB3A|nr:SURF1 family protein [Saccharospirillum mangrovi]